MDRIYAPWRQSYVTGVEKKETRFADASGCVFCTAFLSDEDEQYFILKRTQFTVVMLNLYPYAGGHVMVLPYEHKGDLSQLDTAVRIDLMEQVTFSIEALKKALFPHGFNVGLNLGEAGGGGVPSHLHMHVLPRWKGDTNFMPLLSNTRPVSCSMEEIYATILPFFK